jgi:hypothetical protein
VVEIARTYEFTRVLRPTGKEARSNMHVVTACLSVASRLECRVDQYQHAHAAPVAHFGATLDPARALWRA